MKTAEEWFYEYEDRSAVRVQRLMQFIKSIQSDAFRAGKLAAIDEIKVICEKRHDSYNEDMIFGDIMELAESLTKQ